MWSEKYRPRTISAMVGNEQARSAVHDWLATWNKKSKPVLMSGPPGIGKTTLARILAERHGYDMIGLNASDTRSKARLAQVLDPVVTNAGLSGRTIIFLDEVDGIHGRSDYGGVETLLRILKSVTIPVMMAANSEDAGRMKDLVKVSMHVRFRPIPPRLLRVYLNDVLKSEGVTMGPGTVIRTVSESGGDVRSLLNLAQSLVTGFSPDTAKSFGESSMEEGIDAFFKAKSIQEASSVMMSIQADPREKINALYSAVVTATLDQKTRARMLDVLSEADMLYGRILRGQNWRLLRYLNSILQQLYREGLPVRYTRYNLPFPILNRIRFEGRAWRALNRYVGGNLHMSGSAAACIAVPFYIRLVKEGRMERVEEHADIISKGVAK